MAEYSLYDHNQFKKIYPQNISFEFSRQTNIFSTCGILTSTTFWLIFQQCDKTTKKAIFRLFFVRREFDPLKMHFIHLLQVE